MFAQEFHRAFAEPPVRLIDDEVWPDRLKGLFEIPHAVRADHVHAFFLQRADQAFQRAAAVAGEQQNCCGILPVASGPAVPCQIFFISLERIVLADVEKGAAFHFLRRFRLRRVDPLAVDLIADEVQHSAEILLSSAQILLKKFPLFVRQRVERRFPPCGRRGVDGFLQAGEDFLEGCDGLQAALDGFSGELILEPDETTLAGYQEKQKGREERQKLLAELRGKEDVTADGRRMDLFANVGSLEEVKRALENDARGIGLFRTEFLYLGKTDFPSEEEQFQAYKEALEQMEGKKVIIRTLDVGADKQTDYLQMEPEANPALGCRGIRLCLRRPDIFKTQLRALVRASAYGNLGILYPMIISVGEIRQIKALVNEVKAELEEEGISYESFEQGVMIETPAAVMISSALAKEVDFFSIGTNDLTQYTLAVDRQDVKLDDLFDLRHPAVMDLIRMTVKNGHAGGCRVGICGELGADPALTGTFLEMGVDELSVTPASVLRIRKIIRAI